MKRFSILLILGLVCSAVQAQQLFRDDFSRANKTYTGGIGSTFGAGWVGGNKFTTADLTDQEVLVTGKSSAAQGFAMMRNDILTENSGVASFEMSGGARIDQAEGGSWAGLIFNCIDGNNFYVFRYSVGGGVQFITVEGGATVAAQVNVSEAFTHVQNRKYEVSVSSTDPYTFNLSVRDTVTGSVVWSGSATDADSRFADGKGGFWANNLLTCFDDFSLHVDQPAESTTSDDFNRADTIAQTNLTASIGSSWTSGNVNSDAVIFSNKVDVVQVGDGNAGFIALNTDAATLNVESSDEFTISSRIQIDFDNNGGAWGGLVFNYFNDSYFYLLRMSAAGSVQFLVMQNDGWASVSVNVSGAFTHVQNRPYKMTVSSSEVGVFDFSIYDTVAGQEVFSTNAVTDASARYGDGSAGLWANSDQVMFDNFSMAMQASYSSWVIDFGVGAGDEDADGDGLSNLAEYGLGGNPTNAVDTGISCVSSADAGASVFTYVYPRRLDASDLEYSLEIAESLMGAWTNIGYTVIGTNQPGGDFEYITNSVPMDADQKFIRLKISTQ